MKFMNCMLFIAIGLAIATAQHADLKTRDALTLNSHKADSYVLILGSNVIERGPDFSQRQRAIKYAKKHRLKDLAWFSTRDGHFVLSDRRVLSGLKELEKPQDEVSKQEDKAGSNYELQEKLRHEQNRLSLERDVHVWEIYEHFRHDDRLIEVASSLSTTPSL